MMKEAEQHAEEDRRLAELATARNQAEALVHSTQKSLEEHGDKLQADEKEAIEKAVAEREEGIKDGDKAGSEEDTEGMTDGGQNLGEKIYADMQAQQQAQAGGDAEQSQADDDVVDADFKEVKRD